MSKPALTFIGAGNMAQAIIGGLIARDYPASAIAACAPSQEELDRVAASHGVRTSLDNQALMGQTDVLILCTKPQVLQAVCEDLAESVQQRKPLIVSIAAGVTSEQIESWLGGNLPVVRCMPNTPAQVHMGASGLFANSQVSDEQKSQATELFKAVGLTVWVDSESDLHTVTALSGSGPAYCFMFIEALEAAAADLGLNAADARALAIQTLRGASELAARSDEAPATLRKRVMSPGGTTEQAVKRFEEQDLAGVVANAVKAAWTRSYELAGENPPA